MVVQFLSSQFISPRASVSSSFGYILPCLSFDEFKRKFGFCDAFREMAEFARVRSGCVSFSEF